jgi:hypothetical protein
MPEEAAIRQAMLKRDLESVMVFRPWFVDGWSLIQMRIIINKI